MDPKVAYLSAEFALDDALPIYAGGLGVLAADILYQAADQNLPLAGITIFYREGFFQQKIDPNGTQKSFYKRISPEDAGLEDTGQVIKVTLTDHEISLKIWRKDVSFAGGNSVPLYLMDAELKENRPEDRKINDRLYERVWAPHIIDDLILGVGSVRLARQLNLPIKVWHINDDHGTLNILERLREQMVQGLSLSEAREKVKAETVFTTHTPVDGAESKFTRGELFPLLTVLFAGLKVDLEEIWQLGKREWQGQEVFSLTVFAMRHSREVNAVSQRHFDISRELWKFIGENVPTSYVTNAVYAPRWTPEEKDKLEVKKRAAREIQELSLDKKTFDPNSLVLAWCRRFTNYKQPNLLLTDGERLLKILTNPDKPVYLLMAGKAHPEDSEGQEFVRRVIEFSRRSEVKNHFIYVPNYSLTSARSLLAASDVWLNTPRVGWEASGTSGMKAIFNQSLNAMTPDGWWPEGYNGKNGWLLEPEKDDYATPLYRVIEKEIVPTYYQNQEKWQEMIQEAQKTCGEKFAGPRMLKEYLKIYQI
ncbi:MAG: alpha-glucan family phosphorylase [Patescibacteria group bacterium]